MKQVKAKSLTLFVGIGLIAFLLVLVVQRAPATAAVSEHKPFFGADAAIDRKLEYVGEIGQDSWSAWDVAVQDNLVFIADISAGLRVVDVSDPTLPVEVTSYGPFTSLGVDVAGNYVFHVGGGKLRVLDISALPIIIESDTVGIPFPTSVAVFGEHLYVTSSDGLYIFDKSNPSSLRQVGFLDTPDGQLYEVYVTGEFAYIAEGGPFDNYEGLRVVNVSNPTKPILVGSSVDLDGTISEGVTVSGQYAYVTTWDGGVHVIDISDPANPLRVGGINPKGTDRGIAISEELMMAFVASDPISAIDISQGTILLEVDTYDTPGSGRDLAIKGSFIYVVDQFRGLTILRFVRSVSATIPESGGQLASTFDDTNYSFPVGLFSDTIVVRHSLLLEEDAPRTGQLVSANHFFDVSATFLTSGQPAQPEPGKTYTVTIGYDSEDIGPIKEEKLALYRWNGAASRWSPNEITSVVDTDSHSLSAKMSQFSVYGLLGDSERIFLPSVSGK